MVLRGRIESDRALATCTRTDGRPVWRATKRLWRWLRGCPHATIVMVMDEIWQRQVMIIDDEASKVWACKMRGLLCDAGVLAPGRAGRLCTSRCICGIGPMACACRRRIQCVVARCNLMARRSVPLSAASCNASPLRHQVLLPGAQLVSRAPKRARRKRLWRLVAGARNSSTCRKRYGSFDVAAVLVE